MNVADYFFFPLKTSMFFQTIILIAHEGYETGILMSCG